MWNLVPCLEIKARPPALGAQSLNYWILNHRILTTGLPGKSLNKFMDKFSYPYSRVFPCSGTLLILESLPMGQAGIFCLFMTALPSLQPSQHLSQLHYLLLRAGGGGSVFSLSSLRNHICWFQSLHNWGSSPKSTGYLADSRAQGDSVTEQPMEQERVWCSGGTVQLSSVAPSCLTLCDPMDCSMPGLHVHLQLP